MSKVSVYMIAFNQMDKIAAAINSVRWADEVVVIDSHSTDGTTELAERLGATVMQVSFRGFGDLRNQAVAACQHEWIFSLDSDERCTTEARDEILSIVNGNAVADIYMMPRKNYFMGRQIKYCGWYPDYRQPQLFRNGSVRYDAKDKVHENYICHSDKPIAYLKNPIWQEPFRNLSEMMSKANRYSTLGIERLAKRYDRASMGRAVSHMLWTFIKCYVLRRGFLDGWPGLVISMGHSYGAFYRYAKFYEHEQQWPTLPNQAIYTDRVEQGEEGT